MNDERLEHLMDLALDGEANDQERAALERHLDNVPGARERMVQRRALFETLERVPRRGPPLGLRDSVLTAIRREPVRPVGRWEALQGLLRRRPLPYAVAGSFVLGSLATLLVVGLNGTSPQRESLSGAMIHPAVKVASVPLGIEGAHLEVVSRRSESELLLDIGGSLTEPGEIVITFDGNELVPTGMTPPRTTDSRLEASAGRTRIAAQGDIAIRLSWQPRVARTQPVRVSLRVGDRETQALLVTHVEAPQGP